MLQTHDITYMEKILFGKLSNWMGHRKTTPGGKSIGFHEEMVYIHGVFMLFFHIWWFFSWKVPVSPGHAELSAEEVRNSGTQKMSCFGNLLGI